MKLKFSLLPPASLGQGYVFTPVCHSVHRGINFEACITGHMTGDLHPGGSPFEGSASRGVCIQEGLGRPHLVCIGGGLGRPSFQDTWDTTGYGQQAGGTHLTGMLSCLLWTNKCNLYWKFFGRFHDLHATLCRCPHNVCRCL